MKEKKKFNKKEIFDKILLGLVALICAFVSIFGLVKGSKVNTLDNTSKTTIKNYHKDNNGNLVSDNILNNNIQTQTINGVTITSLGDNKYQFSGTATETINSENLYIFTTTKNKYYALGIYDLNGNFDNVNSTYFYLYFHKTSSNISYNNASISNNRCAKTFQSSQIILSVISGATLNFTCYIQLYENDNTYSYPYLETIYYSQDNYNSFGSQQFAGGVQSAQNVLNADIVRNNMTYLSHGWDDDYEGVSISTPFTAFPKYAEIEFNAELESRAKVINNVSYNNVCCVVNYVDHFDILTQKNSACYRLPIANANKGLINFHFQLVGHFSNNQSYTLNLYHYFNSNCDSLVINQGTTAGFYNVNQCFNSNYLTAHYLSYTNPNKTFYLSDGIDLFINKIKDDFNADIQYLTFNYFGVYKDTDSSNKNENLHEYIDLFFNVQSNNSSLMYSTGYEKGYNNGYSNGCYDTKRDDYDNLTKEQIGENAVVNYINNNQEPINLSDIMESIFEYPYKFVKDGLDVDFLGINLASVCIFIIGAFLTIFVVKKVLK